MAGNTVKSAKKINFTNATIKAMRKKQEKKDYERPVCLVYEMKSETFFCVSVTPAPMTSHEEDWDSDEEKEFGEVWVE